MCANLARHCEGPRSTEVAAEEETLAPSPTESVGCEPHGDHWYVYEPSEWHLKVSKY